MTYSCASCSKEVREDNCLGDGMYCPIMPPGKLPLPLRDIKGKQLIEESLREKCLYQVLQSDYKRNRNFTSWFKYTITFLDTCSTTETFNKDCSYGVMKTLNLDSKAVDDCVNSAQRRAGSSRSTKIDLFEDDNKFSKQIGVVMHPSISINNITFRGEINGMSVFKGICAGFLEQPDVCKGDQVIKYLMKKGTGDLRVHHFNLVRLYHIIAAVFLVLILNLAALYVYRKYQKRQINEELQLQVNSAVSQYFRLSGQESNA